MKQILIILMTCLFISACSDDGRTYIGENNYYVMAPSEVGENKGTFEYQHKMFPQYVISRAKEWPREDLNNASSYDLPRIQFYWANMGDEKDPMYNEYEGSDKIWSMKTDGTDLRLVTDEFPIKFATGTGKMIRSPNMRYLAYGYSGVGKAVYDLKTGETYDLDATGGYGMLWSEDSSYLYFVTRERSGLVTYKWDIETKKSVRVDVAISDTGVILDGRRIVVSDGGVGIYSEKDNELVEGIVWYKKLNLNPDHLRSWIAEYRSVSPLGKYAWVESPKYTFFIDVTKRTVEIRDQTMPYLLGLDGRYATAVRHAMVMDVRDTENKVAWLWRPLGSGKRTLQQSSLYNGLANNGIWFKEGQ
ncbi:tricorn protease N-terminal domain-containing protein [Vibrio maritimus]|uniref:Tricorn protease N-terminal domain-containing protein n=1 Tax=Vibrio maritimus TaxID=990268 RepID=A0A090S242_9VIBR|nr:tricorn protease N-terminal domain-containing protein [Vibrio maritimus]